MIEALVNGASGTGQKAIVLLAPTAGGMFVQRFSKDGDVDPVFEITENASDRAYAAATDLDGELFTFSRDDLRRFDYDGNILSTSVFAGVLNNTNAGLRAISDADLLLSTGLSDVFNISKTGVENWGYTVSDTDFDAKAIAVDSTGDIIVAYGDQISGQAYPMKVIKLSATGSFVWETDVSLPTAFSTENTFANNIVFDSSDNIYIGHPSGYVKLLSDGTQSWARRAFSADFLLIDNQDTLYVAYASGGDVGIDILDASNGNFLSSFYESSDGSLSFLVDVAMDNEFNFYLMAAISGTSTRKLLKIDGTTGSEIWATLSGGSVGFTKIETTDGYYNSPYWRSP